MEIAQAIKIANAKVCACTGASISLPSALPMMDDQGRPYKNCSDYLRDNRMLMNQRYEDLRQKKIQLAEEKIRKIEEVSNLPAGQVAGQKIRIWARKHLKIRRTPWLDFKGMNHLLYSSFIQQLTLFA